MIAGGVGVAPLLGIARQLRAQNDPRPIILLYGNRVADQIVYPDELEEMARRPGSKLIHILSEPNPGWAGLTGRVDRAAIEQAFAFDGAAQWLYLVCGPSAMLDGVEDALVALGVPGRQIVSERFVYD